MIGLRALDRKLIRDLGRMRLQAAAIALLVACGVSVAVMAFSAQDALSIAEKDYFGSTRFADVFAVCTRAPLQVARDLQQVDGVVAVDARAVKAGLMSVPGLVRLASARLISLPDDPRQALNRLTLVAGRMPAEGRADEAVALKTFLDAAHVGLGQRLTMVIAGREMTFSVVGSVLSPEFVYLPAPASMLPDDAHQGLFWAPRLVAGKATGMDGAFSSVSLKLAPGARLPAVLAAVDRALAPYGGSPAIGRADQVSEKFIDDRIARFGILAWVIPPTFLAVAAGLVHMALGRVVEAERDQIGLLKAFGYSDAEVGAVYLKMAAIIALVGAAAGGLLGAWMGGAVTRLLAQYVRFPHLSLQFSWPAFGLATLFSVAAALAGSLLAVRRAVRLSPAVAMQPPAPTVFRAGVLERLPAWRRLDQPTRMIVRNLERFPMRAALTLGGLAMSLTLLVGTQFMFGSLDRILDQAYFEARHWTDMIGFAELRDARAGAEVARLPGVIAAEPVRYAAARVRANGRDEKVFVTGIDRDAKLARALDADGAVVPLKGRGLILSDSLALSLKVKPGEPVELEITEGRRPRTSLPVTGLDRDYAGLSIFMDRQEMNRLMGDGDLASGENMLTSGGQRAAFYGAVERAPMIAAAISRSDTVTAFRGAVTDEINGEMLFYIGFAGAIAFGVAYNVSRIALAARSRDLATLRVLGFSPLECAYILLGELVFLALAATPLGVLGGFGVAQALVAAFSRQELQLPMIITAHSYGVAFAAYLVAVLAAVALVGRQVWALDLVSALKTRD